MAMITEDVIKIISRTVLKYPHFECCSLIASLLVYLFLWLTLASYICSQGKMPFLDGCFVGYRNPLTWRDD